MIVISDTSPLTALLSVGEADILPKLFSEVVIPEAVRDELRRSHSHLPPWLQVAAVANQAQANPKNKFNGPLLPPPAQPSQTRTPRSYSRTAA